MMRQPEEFKQAATEKNIQKWVIHHCSMCSYPCGYIFRGDQVFYDSGCDCVTYGPALRPADYKDVAEQYNNSHKWWTEKNNAEELKKLEEFWGFAKAESETA